MPYYLFSDTFRIDVTLWRFRGTIVAVEKAMNIPNSECVFVHLDVQHAPYSHLWPLRLYDILQHSLTNGTILGKGAIEQERYILIIATIFKSQYSVWVLQHGLCLIFIIYCVGSPFDSLHLIVKYKGQCWLLDCDDRCNHSELCTVCMLNGFWLLPSFCASVVSNIQVPDFKLSPCSVCCMISSV